MMENVDLKVLTGGWVAAEWSNDTPPVTVFAKTRLDGGKRVITALMFYGDTVHSKITMRFPTSLLLRAVNEPGIDWPASDAEEPLDEYLIYGMWLVEQRNQAEPARPDDVTPPPPKPKKPAGPAPLRRPDGKDPEGFSRHLAEVYQALEAGGFPPAATIAKRLGVPDRTVHRWVGEARKRGHLPAYVRVPPPQKKKTT